MGKYTVSCRYIPNLTSCIWVRKQSLSIQRCQEDYCSEECHLKMELTLHGSKCELSLSGEGMCIIHSVLSIMDVMYKFFEVKLCIFERNPELLFSHHVWSVMWLLL